jgi:hypothetical protein
MLKARASPLKRCPVVISTLSIKKAITWQKLETWGDRTWTLALDSCDLFSLSIMTSMRGQHSKASRTQLRESMGTCWSMFELTVSTNDRMVLPIITLLLNENVSSLRLLSHTKERNRSILT